MNVSQSNESRPQSLSPVIFFATPTYGRREQFAELTRLSNTLAHVKDLVWVVIEDDQECSQRVQRLLERSPVDHWVQMAAPMPAEHAQERYPPKGVAGRNAAIDWVVENKDFEGVLYFGDDDNAYHLRLFDEIRSTKGVSVFPTGLVTKQSVSGPIVDNTGKVVGFTDGWPDGRRFPLDMASFAVNVRLLRKSKARMAFKAGHEEDLFLRDLGVKLQDLEVKANGGTEILVWHTRTESKPAPHLRLPSNSDAANETNLQALLATMEARGEAARGGEAAAEDSVDMTLLWRKAR